jgi:hypothetical protein
MRRITVYQKDSDSVELLDDSDTNLEEYCRELSKLFQMTNVSILKTSHSTFIGRPSQLIGIVVEDTDTGEIMEETPEVENTTEGDIPDDLPKEEEIEEDIITDID